MSTAHVLQAISIDSWQAARLRERRRRLYRRRARTVIAALVLAGAINVLGGTRADAQEQVYTPDDTLAAIDQYSDEMGVSRTWLLSIVRCETAGTFNPYSIGRQGELGAVQLHPRGELRRFLAWGYTDPFSPWQSVRFLAQRLTMGGARAWSCA